MMLDSNDCELTENYYSRMYSSEIISEDYFNLYNSIVSKSSI